MTSNSDQSPAVHPPPSSTVDFDSADGLPIPPLDSSFLSDNFHMSDHIDGTHDLNDVVLDDLDFDFSFDDLCLPHPDATDLFNPNADSFLYPLDTTRTDSDPIGDLTNSPGSLNFRRDRTAAFEMQCSDQNSSDSRVLNSDEDSSGFRSSDVLGYLNVPSPDSNSNDSNPVTGNEGSNEVEVLNCSSPESQGSGNFGSDVSEAKSVSSSPNLVTVSEKNNKGTGSNQRVKSEEMNSSNSYNSCLLKRKKEDENSANVESKANKCRRGANNNNNVVNDDNNSLSSEEEEKRKARLMRNRESAQLSRQRKKHYVEELEDKVRTMHSTIQDLNAKVTYVMAENANLKQQLGSASAGGVGAPPPPMPPAPGMYPHPPVMYPWMPYAPPPYMVKPQGSQVPLVPIPRLKPQQSVSVAKGTKKGESKKSEGNTKKVASVSFIGFLLFILLFGGFTPMVNLRYGGLRDAVMGNSDIKGFYESHSGRILPVNGLHYNRTDYPDSSVHSDQRCHDGRGRRLNHTSNHMANGSEPLLASLYVPRNDKLVKIDGNLIIHSVLASEKAMASRQERESKIDDETGLAIPGHLAPAVRAGRHPHLYKGSPEGQRALGSGDTGEQKLKSPVPDSRLQQWFREGLAGPMLSSGMCTEVFQFDMSPSSGAIIPAPSTRNITTEQKQNSTRLNKARNRRILNGLPVPLPGSSHNSSQDHARRKPEKGKFSGNNSLSSSMVVSVLVDPREAGDADGDGVMGPKSLSRIFVVVLVDSVKYVTYSCMLPFMGASPHLVTA